jgi:hypothetical protein
LSGVKALDRELADFKSFDFRGFDRQLNDDEPADSEGANRKRSDRKRADCSANHRSAAATSLLRIAILFHSIPPAETLTVETEEPGQLIVFGKFAKPCRDRLILPPVESRNNHRRSEGLVQENFAAPLDRAERRTYGERQ